MAEAKNQIAYRQRVAIHADAAVEGSSQPDYTHELVQSAPAEVRQVSGGEIVRGKTVEQITSHVVSLRYIPGLSLTGKIRVTVLSGTYKDQLLYVHRVHVEDMAGRPRRYQLHCKTRG